MDAQSQTARATKKPDDQIARLEEWRLRSHQSELLGQDMPQRLVVEHHLDLWGQMEPEGATPQSTMAFNVREVEKASDAIGSDRS